MYWLSIVALVISIASLFFILKPFYVMLLNLIALFLAVFGFYNALYFEKYPQGNLTTYYYIPFEKVSVAGMIFSAILISIALILWSYQIFTKKARELPPLR